MGVDPEPGALDEVALIVAGSVAAAVTVAVGVEGDGLLGVVVVLAKSSYCAV